jgi:protein-S-isoprenylcysteine O-methyltransferase Ste14
MQKLLLASISNILMIILPLLGTPSLMSHPKIIFIIIGSISIWLTQPAFTLSETTDKKQSDKFSVILILIMSLVAVVTPIIDWAYFKTEHSELNAITFIGIVMVVSGIVFRAWSVRTLGKFFTPTVQIKDEHQLITWGPYSIVRHPSYLGAFLSITGGAIILESPIGFIIGCTAMFIAYYVRISIEERELASHFQHSYKHYRLTTPRIIPFIW